MTESVGMLELLGVLEREISISRLIGAALKRSPVALDILTGRPGQREDLEVHTERAFALPSGRSRRADLLATWWQDHGPHALVVEHKLFAGEGVDQSVDYAAARDLFACWAKDRFPDRPGKAAEVSIVMLTLLGDPPRGETVRHVRHIDLAPALAAIAGDDAGASLAREWAGLVRDHAATSALDANTVLAEAFSAREGPGLDPRYGRFQYLAKLIEDAGCGQLELHGTYRSGRSGRSWYGAHFALAGTAPSWDRAAKMPLNPATDWWLHFQLRLEASSNSSLTLGAFCETLPYVPQGIFNAEAGDATQRSAYRAARQSLQEGFRRIADRPGSRWRARGDWCQIARFAPTWEGEDSVTDVARGVAAAMVEISDDALAMLHAARSR